MKFILTAFIIHISLLSASSATYLEVNLHSFPCGMFSVFSYIAGVLYDYDTHDYAGIEVNFEKFGIYYDPAYGPNWWEYYCEPIQLGNKTNVDIKKFNVSDHVKYAYFVEEQLHRQQVYHLIEKYIKIRPSIQMKVDNFVSENFESCHIIGVHYRGTDKITEARRVSYLETSTQIHKYIRKNSTRNYKIFVATDELQFLQFMNNSFPGSIITYSTLHSENEVPLHLNSSNTHLQGEEALVDCLLLSKCAILIKTSSNLSLWATYFNPLIPVIELSKRG